MIRMCYSQFHIGDRIFGEKEPLRERHNITYGLCDECYKLEVKKISEELEQIVDKYDKRVSYGDGSSQGAPSAN